MIKESPDNLVLEKTGIPVPLYRIKKLTPESIDRCAGEVLALKHFLFSQPLTPARISEKLNANKKEGYAASLETLFCDSLMHNSHDKQLSENDKCLIAIAFWQYVTLPKLSSGRAIISVGVSRVLSSQFNPVASEEILAGERIFTCFDTAAISLVLARALGVNGTIENYWHGDPKSLHHFFETEDGRILDVNSGVHAAGFFLDKASHAQDHSTKMNNQRREKAISYS